MVCELCQEENKKWSVDGNFKNESFTYKHRLTIFLFLFLFHTTHVPYYLLGTA